MAILKQSTSYARKFIMVLSSDHTTGATGKTVAVELSKGAGAAGTAAAGTVTELDSTNLPGHYQVSFTAADTNTQGDLSVRCTAAGCDATDFIDQVQVQIFTDLQLDNTGHAIVASNFKQNTAITIPFVMTISGVPTPGLSVSGFRNFGSGYSGIAGTITDLGNGGYKASLLAADTNNAFAFYRFTATGADDRDLSVVFTP